MKKKIALDEQFYMDGPSGSKKFFSEFELEEVTRKNGVYEVWNASILGKSTKGLASRTDLITRREKVDIKFEYPLSNPVTLSFKSKHGFTKEKILQCVREGYTKIYKEEGKATDKYGIWGHGIGDLVIAGAKIKDGVISLVINS